MSHHQFIEGKPEALQKRGISEDICKRFRYHVGRVPEDYQCSEKSALHPMKGKKVQIENYYDDDGNLKAQKLRDAKKNFAVIGKIGDSLWGKKSSPAGGKVIVVTEGALDALSYAEVRKNWPVVSIPNGVDAAHRTLRAESEYLSTFDKIVLAFDNDEPAAKALEKCKGILPAGKVFMSALPAEYKDFNEALQEGDVKAIITATFNAVEDRPDGIVDIDDIMEEVLKPAEWGLPWFIPELTDLTYGRRYGEVLGFGAPTGGGKTDLFTEQAMFDINELDLRIGMVMLEQKPVETAKRLAGKEANHRFHIPDAGWTNEELHASVLKLGGKVKFYDSFGQTEWERVKSAIRHMNVADGIRIFYLDHLTAMADTSDEKGSIEQIMKEMAGLANELNIIIHFISHLTTPEGTPHEEGGRISIRHFKGSRAIGFWSHGMFGLERDQQAENEAERCRTTFRILKDRLGGRATGTCLTLGYNFETGRVVLPQDMTHESDLPLQKDEQF